MIGPDFRAQCLYFISNFHFYVFTFRGFKVWDAPASQSRTHQARSQENAHPLGPYSRDMPTGHEDGAGSRERSRARGRVTRTGVVGSGPGYISVTRTGYLHFRNRSASTVSCGSGVFRCGGAPASRSPRSPRQARSQENAHPLGPYSRNVRVARTGLGHDSGHEGG